MKKSKSSKKSRSGSSRSLKSKKKSKSLRKSKPKKVVKKTGKKNAKKSGKSSARKAGPVKPVKPPVPGTLIGHISHYFPHVNAAAFKIEKGTLKVGDQVYIKGHTTDFKQAVESIQIDHVPVSSAGKGDDIGIGVKDRVREHDSVYKLD